MNLDIDKINKTFAEKECDWELIMRNCNNFFIYSSDNDPYVPIEKSEELANKLESKVRLVKSAGHFNQKAGYLQFKILLEDIKKEL